MLRTVKKFFNSNVEKPLSFAIIGSGPGGFYSAKHLIKHLTNVKVDIYERLPHPFGLVRTGVAPDHQKMKNVMKDFTSVLEDTRVNFFGNINVGQDISFKSLQENYSAVVLAYGADNEYNLDIPNEHVYGSFSGRMFVNWYNGHVDYPDLQFPLDGEDAVIIGNGNVAVDLARMLAKSYDDLKEYDIAEPLLEKLTKNKVKKIHMIGRRGILESAFTLKEMRELSRVNKLKTFVFENDLKESMNELSVETLNAHNPAEKKHSQRKFELLQSFNIVKDEDELNRSLDKDGKNLILRYFLAPKTINTDSENNIVQSVSFNKTSLAKNDKKSIFAKITHEHGIKIDTNLMLKSIGYKSIKQFDEIEFSNKFNTIVNLNGKVYNSHHQILENVFTVGWVKTGAKGIIDSTLRDSYATAETMFASINDGLLVPKEPDRKAILENADKYNVKYITYDQWKKVDQVEIEEGKKRGKVREKILSREKMLEIALN